MEYRDAIPESVVIKDTFGSSYKQSQEQFTPSPSPSPTLSKHLRAGLVWVTH